MSRKKRRSKQFKDSSKVIDMEQARADRQAKRRTKRRSSSGRSGSIPQDAAPERAAEEAVTGAASPDEAERTPLSSERLDRRRMELRRRKQRRKLLVIAVIGILIVIIGISFANILMLKHDLHKAKQQQEEYTEEKAQLEEDMKEINDLQYLEEQARDQMRLIKPGEMLYIFPEEMTKK